MDFLQLLLELFKIIVGEFVKIFAETTARAFVKNRNKRKRATLPNKQVSSSQKKQI